MKLQSNYFIIFSLLFLTFPYLVFYYICNSRCRSFISPRSRKGDSRMSYLVCDKRKGSPKIHVEVCRRKCKLIQECKTYKEFVDTSEKKAA